jgi:hypothetical protein
VTLLCFTRHKLNGDCAGGKPDERRGVARAAFSSLQHADRAQS